MMDGLYLLPPDSWSAEWTKGQGRPLVKARFSPYLKLCVLVQAVCVCLCVLMYILAAVLPLVEDSRPHSPFPSAPAQPPHPPACCTDRQSCHGDG